MVLFIAAARNDADNARYLNGEVLQRNLSTSVHPSFPRHATPFDQALLSLMASYLIYQWVLLFLCYWLCGLVSIGWSYLQLDVQLMSGKFNIVHLPLSSVSIRTHAGSNKTYHPRKI